MTAPVFTQTIRLELPKESFTDTTDSSPIVIAISAGGRYYWHDLPVTEVALMRHLESTAADNPSQPIHLRVDTQVAYGNVSRVLALSQQYGLHNIGFVTQQAPQ